MKARSAFLFAVLAVSAGLLLASCAGPSSNQVVCPESRHVRCITPLICEPDTARGCDVCICEGDSNDPAYEGDHFEGNDWDGQSDPWQP